MWVENGFFIWDKGHDFAFPGGWFVTSEFACHCSRHECVEQRIATDLVRKLQAVREELKAPLAVSSGFRCHAHQQDLAASGRETAKGLSQHELGRAADISTRRMTDLVPILKRHFKAVGTAPTWAHVDLRDDKERRWTYAR